MCLVWFSKETYIISLCKVSLLVDAIFSARKYISGVWFGLNVGLSLLRLHRTLFRKFQMPNLKVCRSQWPRCLRRRYSAARLLRLWVRVPPGTWVFGCCECCVLSGRSLCDRLIIRPEESTDCGASLCVMKKPRKRGGWSQLPGSENTITTCGNARETNKQTIKRTWVPYC